MPAKIVLASTSKYRKKLLEQLAVPFVCVAPAVDEDKLKNENSVSLSDLPLFLARKKAESLVSVYPESVIIGSDQMGLHGNRSLNKAGSREKAIDQLLRLQGSSHTLLTAVSVFYKGTWFDHVDTTTLHMRSLTPGQITRYVDIENPIDCAGSYKVESLGIALFEKIETEDSTAIVGLPLIALCRILEAIGQPVLGR